MLIKAHIDVDLGNKYDTPLIIACHLSIVQLITMGAAVNLDKHYKTPLHLLVKRAMGM